jgi:hypothetical protein
MKGLGLRLFCLNGFGCLLPFRDGWLLSDTLEFFYASFFQLIVFELVVCFHYFWQSFCVYCFESCGFFSFFWEVGTTHLSRFKIHHSEKSQDCSGG